MIIETIAVAYLVLLSIIDIHYNGKDFGLIPTALTTFFIILMVYLNGLLSLFGLSVFTLFGFMLYELKFYEGSQDIKVMAGLGCLAATVNQTLSLVALILIVGVGYKLMIYFISKGKVKRIPFIPVLTAAFIIYLLFEVLL